MNKGLIFLALGSIVVAAFSFIKLTQHRRNKALTKKEEKKEMRNQNQQSETSVECPEVKNL